MRPWVGPAILAAVCAVGVVLLELRPREPADPGSDRRQVSAEAIALLDGLTAGERIAGWSVLGLSEPREGGVRVDFGRDDLRFSVTVTALGQTTHAAPRSTERYALYYGHPHPRGAKIPDGAVRAIMAGLERRIRANEANVALP
ncbi:MAG: hypothetical protein AAGA54_21430 [Myxococcota bacterium]